MKKTIIAGALVASLALVACNNDSATPAPTDAAAAVESMAAEAQATVAAVESMAAEAENAAESMAADAEGAVEDAIESAAP